MIYSLRNLIFSFAIVIIVVLLIVLRTFSTLRSQEQELVKIRQSREALQKLGPAVANMQEFESISANYFNTGNSKLFDSYNAVLKKLQNDSISMAALAVTNTQNSSSYRELSNLIHGMIGYSTANITLRPSPEYGTRINTEAGFVIVEKFKKIANRLEAENREILNESYSESISLTRETFVFVRIIAGVLAFVLIISFFFIYHDIKTRKKTEEHLKKFNVELEKQVNEKTLEIRESEEKYRSLFESMMDAYSKTDMSGRFIEYNPAFRNMIGFSDDEIYKLSYVDITPAKWHTIETDILNDQLLTRGYSDVYEKEYTHRDGRIFPVELRAFLLRNKSGQAKAVWTIVRDISERKKAEQEVQKSEERYRSAIEQASDAIMVTDQKGGFIEVNTALCNQFGYTKEELIGSNISKLIDPDQLKTDPIRFDLLVSGQTVSRERRMMHKKGTIIEVEANVKMLPDGRIMAIARDITERKKAEEQIIKEKNLSDSVINSLPGVFFLLNTEGRYLKWNKEFENISGYNADEIRKLNALDFFQGHGKGTIYKAIEKVFTEGSVQIEANAVIRTGEKVPYFFTGQLIHYEDQPCLIGTGIDITERKKAEQALINSEETRRLIMNSSLDAIICMDTAGRVTVWTPQAEKVFGWNEEEVMGQLLANIIIPPQYREIHKKGIENYLGTGKGVILNKLIEITAMNNKGEEFPVELTVVPFEQQGQTFFCGFIRDITDRKKASEDLKKSQANIHTIFNTAETIYVLLDKNLQIISYNQRAEVFATKELQHDFRISDNFLDYFQKERRPVLLASMKEVLKGKHVAYEATYPQADGSFNWYYIRIFPITDPGKKVFGLLWEVSDITEKKILEQEILDQKVQEQKKITRAVLNAEESERNKIGQELHDNVNQILASIKLYLSMIIERDGEDKKELISNSTKLVDNAIEEIRALSKNQVTPLKEINLEELIQSLLDKLDDSTSMKTSFVYNVKEKIIDDDLKLNIYRIVQEQINNILKHAAAAHINIRIVTEDAFLRVSITDDGKGFNPDKKRKGIGISNMINRVESFNGELKIDSSPGKGCKLTIKILC